MYESPIDMIVSEMQFNCENEIVKAVYNCGINVNKEELIKALRYDRDQYDKGYQDAKAEMQWTPCNGEEPDGEVLCCDKYGQELIGWLRYEDDQWICESDGEVMYDAIAYMPLPEPYREGAEE